MGERGEHPEQAEPGKVQSSFYATVSECYRSFGPPLVVGVFVLLGLVAAAQAKQDTYDPNRDRQYANSANNEPPSALEPPIVGLFPPKLRPETAYDTSKTEQYDLVAQRWMAWLTGLLTLFTGTGVLLLWGTLHDTRRVLDETKVATEAAKSAAGAAWKTEETTRETGQAQSRAYVHVPTATLSKRVSQNVFAQPDYYSVLHIKNEGATLANRVEIFFQMGLEYYEYDSTEWTLSEPKRKLLRNVAPGQQMEWPVFPLLNKMRERMNEENEKVPTVLGNRLHFRVWGEVRYSDVHRRRYRSAFQFQSFFPQIEEGVLNASAVHLPVFEELKEEDDC